MDSWASFNPSCCWACWPRPNATSLWGTDPSTKGTIICLPPSLPQQAAAASLGRESVAMVMGRTVQQLKSLRCFSPLKWGFLGADRCYAASHVPLGSGFDEEEHPIDTKHRYVDGHAHVPRGPLATTPPHTDRTHPSGRAGRRRRWFGPPASARKNVSLRAPGGGARNQQSGRVGQQQKPHQLTSGAMPCPAVASRVSSALSSALLQDSAAHESLVRQLGLSLKGVRMSPDNLKAFVLWDTYTGQVDAAAKELSRRCVVRRPCSGASHPAQGAAPVGSTPHTTHDSLRAPPCSGPRLRAAVARALGTRNAPRLEFRLDRPSARDVRVEETLRRLDEERRQQELQRQQQEELPEGSREGITDERQPA